jgi:hypothetical protein
MRLTRLRIALWCACTVTILIAPHVPRAYILLVCARGVIRRIRGGRRRVVKKTGARDALSRGAARPR